MRLITRYILREHVGPLVFAVTTLTSLLLLNYIARQFGNLVGKGLGWDVIGEFFVLSIPFTVAMTLPMAVLIATLYAFSRLAADSEVTALMANGIGVRQLMTPVLGGGLALSLLMVGFNDQVLPRANHRLATLQNNIQQKKPTLALKAQTLNEVSNRGLWMWISQLDQRRNAMRGVTIYDITELQQQSQRTIVADSGLLAFADNKRDLLLTLFDGYVEETRNADPNRLQRTYFRTNVMRVADVANELVLDREGGSKGDREMTVCEMQTALARTERGRDSTLRALARSDPVAVRGYSPRHGSQVAYWYCAGLDAVFGTKVAQAQGLPPAAQQGAAASSTHQAALPGAQRGELPPTDARSTRPSQQRLPPGTSRIPPPTTKPRSNARSGLSIAAQGTLDRMDYADREISSLEIEIQKKFALSLACLIFALLGPPVALRFPRSGVGLTIGVSLSVFALYYVGLIAGETLGNNLKLSPIVAMWAANVILGVVGLALMLRMGRQGATAHGMDMTAFLDSLLPWRGHRRSA